MKRRRLAMLLENLEGFVEPEAELEQYPTSAELASRVLHLAEQHDDLRRVVDLGCGTGVLSVGAALLGARVVGFDRDVDALATAHDNVARKEVGDRVELVRADVGSPPLRSSFDAAVMNPPFGAQNRGADRGFLRTAETLSDVVYTVHNEGSLEFVEGFVEGEVTHAFGSELDIERSFDFHDEEVRSTAVEVYRIESG